MAAIIPLAVTLLPLIPPAIESLNNLIKAIKEDAGTPEEAKAQLDELSARLDETSEKVKNVAIREV